MFNSINFTHLVPVLFMILKWLMGMYGQGEKCTLPLILKCGLFYLNCFTLKCGKDCRMASLIVESICNIVTNSLMFQSSDGQVYGINQPTIWEVAAVVVCVCWGGGGAWWQWWWCWWHSTLYPTSQTKLGQVKCNFTFVIHNCDPHSYEVTFTSNSLSTVHSAHMIFIISWHILYKNQIKSNIYSTHFTMIVYKYLEKYG